MGYITRELRGSVCLLTIDVPPVNALNSQAYFDLYQAMYDCAVDDAVRVVVLTGAGQKAFVAGADVKEFLPLDSDTGAAFSHRNGQVREYIRRFPKPVICAINGVAFGGGCSLALVCDVRIASENAKLSLSAINMGTIEGLVYAAGIGASGTVRKMAYTGEPVTAREALAAGLVDEVVTSEELLPRCMELAEKMAAKPPLALHRAKEVLTIATEQAMADALRQEETRIAALWGTEDKNEAVRAFLEKRTPTFQGK